VDSLRPTTTVLEYLREHIRVAARRKAAPEGDCGACTVVVGELAGEDLRFRAVNACIQFATHLDGKALFNRRISRVRSDGTLQSVQRARSMSWVAVWLLARPRFFVMSLYALYRTDASRMRARYDRRSRETLSLTRVSPISRAARRMLRVRSLNDSEAASIKSFRGSARDW